MKDSFKILVYFAAVVFLGALLAPPLFWGGRWLGGQIPAWGKILIESDFQRYFHRAIFIAAIILLVPVCRWLRVPGVKIFSFGSDPAAIRHLITGLVLSIVVISALAFGLIYLDFWNWKNPLPWNRIRSVLLSAVAVSLAEELFFRGALMKIVMRAASQWWALIFVSALYSAVHFLKPVETAIAAKSVTWLSGFLLLPPSFERFSHPQLLLAGFATLFIFGLVLGYAALKTRALWYSIGLHAGAILAKFSFTKLAKFDRGKDPIPWFSSELTVGIGALGVMLVLFFLVWMTLRKPGQ